ncbi:MAG: glutamyl-tRNA reductase [Acidimicrobiaceae bacterium]|nr:glutamyl-tRNA reductase [Acidimicrobiaceae bacterium]
MSLVVVGCNYRSIPLETLERLTIPSTCLPKMLHGLVNCDNLSEVVVLSTCQRVEVYVSAERFHGGCADVREALSAQSGLPAEVVADELYVFYDEAAARHLFRVTAGLDSVVVGEHEVLGQVRAAWQTARNEGTAGTVLDTLFRSAVETGKRVRSSTAISWGITSLSAAAVALAEAHLDTLKGRKALVIGAGEMGVGVLRSLKKAGVVELFVANRTFRKAESVAAAYAGQAVSLNDLTAVLTGIDLLITTTGASEIIVEHSAVSLVANSRKEVELVIVDVAVPRDVDPSVGSVPGVKLFDMDDIRCFVEKQLANRKLEIGSVKAIVEEKVEQYQAKVSARAVAPLVTALRDHADGICTYELNRHKSRLSGLDPKQWAAVESLVNGVAKKLLHNPTVRLKDASRSVRGDRLAEALSELFDL